MKKIFKAIFSLMIVVFAIVNIKSISAEVTIAVERCLNIIIPSLFIMIVISRFLLSTNILQPIMVILNPLSKLLGLNNELMTVFILSNIGGFPVGASMLSQLTENKHITSRQAEIASSYCFSSGPAFLIGAIGIATYNSAEIGYQMYLSCIAGNILCCILYNRMFGTNFSDSKHIYNESSASITDIIIESGHSMFVMCSIIISFSIVTVALGIFCKLTGINSLVLKPLTEVTNVTELGSLGIKGTTLCTTLTAFGGLCVWLQNTALVKKQFRIIRSLLLRIPVAIISGCIFYAINRQFSADYIQTMSNYDSVVVNIDNFLPSICLIIMIFLTFIKKRLAFQKIV